MSRLWSAADTAVRGCVVRLTLLLQERQTYSRQGKQHRARSAGKLSSQIPKCHWFPSENGAARRPGRSLATHETSGEHPNRWNLIGALVAAVTCTVLSGPALADPFANADLFVGRTLKPSSADRRFCAGAHFQVAPVQAVIQSVVKKKVDEYTAQNPQAKQVVDYIQYVDPKEVKALADSGQVEKFREQLKTELKAQGQLTPEQETAINQIDSQKLKMLATIVQYYNEPEPTTTFALEPYAAVVAGPVQLSAQIPIAGFYSKSKTTLVLGNPGADLKIGGSVGDSGKAFGFAVGGSVWAPLGSEDSTTITLSNPLAAPRFMHDYQSWTGYGVVGAELAFVNLVARGEFVELRPASDRNKDTNPLNDLRLLRYLHTGIGALADLGAIALSLEVDSLWNIKNTKSYHNVWLITGGIRLNLRKVRVGAAIQAPVAKPGDGDAVPVGGINLGSPASFNVLINAQITM